MGRPRVELQKILEDILGSKNVYFQPPETVKIQYPCIIYNRDSGGNTLYADNKPYEYFKAYSVTIIDKDPDTEIPDKVGMLPKSRFDRFYTFDNLNHYVYTLYY